MGGKGSRVRFRCNEALKQGAEQVADQYGIPLSELMRGQMREMIQSHEDDVEHWIYVQSKIDDEKNKVTPKNHAAHLPNNYHEECRGQLEKPYPNDPELQWRDKGEHYEEIIKAHFPEDSEHRQTKLMQLTHAHDMYRFMHPKTESKTEHIIKAATHFARGVAAEEDMEAARGWVSDRVSEGTLPDEFRDEVFDNIKAASIKEWQSEWKDATSP